MYQLQATHEAVPFARNTPSTAGNSMTGFGRPSPEPLLKKEGVPSRTGGERNSGNALEASNALNCRVWAIPAVLSKGNSRKRSESVSGVFPEFFRNFFRKVRAVLGVWPTFGRLAKRIIQLSCCFHPAAKTSPTKGVWQKSDERSVRKK